MCDAILDLWVQGSIPAAPPSSERRRRWQIAAFAALDFEATGLDFSRDRIISFGVVPIDGGQLGIDRRCTISSIPAR
jgi:DNA polymerase III alpha subunit (gram-positive type)